MDFNKKEMPIQGFTGFGGGALGPAFRSSADETKYVDQVFSTYVYRGTGSTRSIVNDLNLSGKGGATWVKNRDQNDNNWLFATSRGAGTGMRTNSTGEEWGFGASGMTSFNSDGFTVGSHDGVNGSNEDMVSWSWRNASGAFDNVIYEGTGSTQQISHSLGCKPGMIVVKNRNMVNNWAVWHKGVASANATYTLAFNDPAAWSTNNTYFDSGSTPPTATNFTVHSSNRVNEDDDNYIAYIFGGGEEQGNASVKFPGSSGNSANGDWIEIPDTADLEIASSDFTMECWFYQLNDSGSGSNSHTLMAKWDNDGRKEFIFRVTDSSGQKLQWLSTDNGSSNSIITGNTTVTNNAWHHAAVTRDSNTIRFFLDGVLQSSTLTQSSTHADSHQFQIGANGSSGIEQFMDGYISNVRFIKGQALWTSNFTVTTEPLTTTSQGATASNVKLLCCNDIGASAFTVSPSALKLKGSVHGNTSSPFAASTATDAGAVFGEDEDKSIMKCGIYFGNGSSIGDEVDIGFEPQYVLIKRVNTTGEWLIYDSMRGIVSGGVDGQLRVDSSALEYDQTRLDLTPTGFIPMTDQQYTNTDGDTYLYFCVRRPDGYVGKPAEAGTDAFAMDYGSGSATIPAFDSTFPVDFTLLTKPDDAHGRGVHTRLNQKLKLRTDENTAETTFNFGMFDSNVGSITNEGDGGGTGSSAYIGYQWKRGAGFDVVSYIGNGDLGYDVHHSLNAVPEMIWIKNRDEVANWIVYHKGLNGGTTPEKYYLRLNTGDAEIYLPDLGLASNILFNDTAPTSTVVTLGSSGNVNKDGYEHIMMLFSSISGISKVGSYDGSGTAQTITTGFQPRFIIIRRINTTQDWVLLDTLRGWVSGSNDPRIELNNDSAPITNTDFGGPISTGFTLVGGTAKCNASGGEYIYYCHA